MSLVGKWTLSTYNYSGGKFQDLTANDNDGTPANAPNYAVNPQGLSNRANVLNGTTDEIFCGTGTELQMGASDWTVSFWLFPTDIAKIATSAIVSRGLSNADGWNIRMGNGAGTAKLYFFTSQAAATQITNSSTVPTQDVWNHIVFTREGADVKIYINKVEVSYNVQATHIDPLDNAARVIAIGARHDSLIPYVGNMCNVQVHNTLLTLAEITAIYNEELSGIAVIASAESDSEIITFASLNVNSENDALITRF